MKMSRFISVTVFWLFLIAVSNVLADDATAKAHFERGKSLAAASKFEDAYRAFEAAYQESPRPAFLFNMGEAARALGDTARARTAYERFVAAEPKGTLADNARRRLAEMPKPAPAPVERAQPAPPPPAPAAKSALAEPFAEPPARPVQVPPPHKVVVSSEPPPASSTLPAAPPPAEGRPLWKKWPFWAAVGGVAATAIVVVAVSSRGGDPCTPPMCVDLTQE
jgi:hypothetical protein